MQTPASDPLLTVARIMLRIAMGMTLAGAAACLLASPVVYVFREQAVRSLASAGAPPETIWGIIGVLVMLSAGLVLSFLFLRHLARIVATVGEGDPFVPVNADRLGAMGWLTLAGQILWIPVSILASWIEHVTDHVRHDFDLPFAGFLLAVVLFVLARVFRKGAEMRAELEGTV